MNEGELCHRLDWDSDFFGSNIARLQTGYMSREVAEQASAWSQANSISCLYFLTDADDTESVRVAEDNHFRFVDIRITLDRRLQGGIAALERGTAGRGAIGAVRPHRPEDIPALKAIAAASHHDSRFYNDPQFPSTMCDALYETWIEKSCNGYAERVFVADVDGQASGYISCHLPAEGEGNIGLVGIAQSLQGRGLGGRLVYAALEWFVEQGVDHVTVVTQGRNANAQRLYQSCGFVTRETQLWYHRWFHM